jgi:hypothetical protein
MSGNNPKERTHIDIYGPVGIKDYLRTTLGKKINKLLKKVKKNK